MKIFDIMKKLLYRGELSHNGIPSEEEFNFLLSRERARSDRNGREFSVIVLEPLNGAGEQFIPPLIKFLKNRLRSTDDLGWFDKDKLGILLPETSFKGAEIVVRNIFLHELMDGKPIGFMIYNYPFRWPKNLQESEFLKNRFSSDDRYEMCSKSIKYCLSENRGLSQPLFACDLPPWKRLIDMVAAAAGLTVLFPLFLLIGAYIKIVSPGPVFFRQERIGCAERKFTCLKFRTMFMRADTSVHEDHLAQLIKNSDTPMKKLDSTDSRIIPFGKFLRKTGIDELPQLINILKGEMSLIGPRPCLPNEAVQYLPWQRKRFDIHPGLTGLWQVNGKNKTTFNQMIRYDVRYAKVRSLSLDFKILLKTIPAVIEQATEKL